MAAFAGVSVIVDGKLSILSWRIAEKKLHEHIGVSTTTAILALAEQHRCVALKEACYEFLRCPANLEAVVATDGFDRLCRSCPSVMKGLVVAVDKAAAS